MITRKKCQGVINNCKSKKGKSCTNCNVFLNIHGKHLLWDIRRTDRNYIFLRRQSPDP